jgi:hypothetical protein
VNSIVPLFVNPLATVNVVAPPLPLTRSVLPVTVVTAPLMELGAVDPPDAVTVPVLVMLRGVFTTSPVNGNVPATIKLLVPFTVTVPPNAH